MEIKCGPCYEAAKEITGDSNDSQRSLALAQARPAVLIYLGKGYCLPHYEKAGR